MKTETQIELYKQVLEVIKSKQNKFICIAIKHLNSSEDNKKFLKEHFFTQLPSQTQYTEIYNEPTFNKSVRNSDYTDIWFLYIDELEDDVNIELNYNLRIKLIEAIINNLENTCV